MNSPDFVDAHRTSQEAFTRERHLPLRKIILFLMNQVQACLQTELDRFFQVLEGAEVAVRRVTKGAFCQARKKFSYRAFVALNQQALDQFYQHGPAKRWRGYRLIACDGTTHRVPQVQANHDHFGQARGDRGQPAAVARVSYAFDVLNDLVVDAIMAPYSTGERRLVVEHLDRFGPTDLLLLDRGYVATWLIHLLQVRGLSFCCRVDPKQYKATRAFRDSGQSEAVITLPASRHSKEMYHKLGLEFKPIQVRIVRVPSPGHDDVFLLTSLPHSVAVLGELYRLRWPVEEVYKRVKCRLEVENFSGKLPYTVYQDFHATVLVANLVSLLSLAAREEFARAPGGRQWPRRLNWTQVMGKLKDTMVCLFTVAHMEGLLAQLMELFQHCCECFRPGRRFPRTKKMNRRVYHMAYKPAH